MNHPVDILGCPFCKLGMDELQARAMEYSIYFLLGLIYSLMGVMAFKIGRMMAREERDLARSAIEKNPAEPPRLTSGPQAP